MLSFSDLTAYYVKKIKIQQNEPKSLNARKSQLMQEDLHTKCLPLSSWSKSLVGLSAVS